MVKKDVHHQLQYHNIMVFKRQNLLPRWARGGAEIILLCVIFWSISRWQTKDLLVQGTLAPPFELNTLDGQVRRLHDAKTESILLYFFAPWCAICNLSIGNLEKLYQTEITSKKLSIFLIALSWNNLEEIKQFVAKHHLTLPLLLGTPELAQLYHIKGFPTYYVLDRKYNIIDKSIGYTTELGLRWRTSLGTFNLQTT